ncbi:hypothetical protein [Dyella acidiphila]|uniref:Uncharacterized protein n=1 Tax=Dyella acidiphila TaxID=2775866 RepID=A0ABR9GFP8_9GAMM|nr:hypothetical protein [Dyella acidiphila]MBE1162871.1 hypothetical protein [Dyella acidiphila]
MAVANDTAPACLSDLIELHFECPSPPDGMLPARSLDRDQRNAAMEQGDAYLLTVPIAERASNAHCSDIPPLLPPGVRLCGPFLPLDSAEPHGVPFALNVLHQHVGSTRRTRGD